MNETNNSTTSELMLKTKLAKLNLKQSIVWSVNIMSRIEGGILDIKDGWLPWNLIAFMKYAGKYAKSKRELSDAVILKVYFYFHNHLRSKPELLLKKTNNLAKFFLRLSHQQMPFQTSLTNLKNKIARQYLFFSRFDEEIIKLVGMDTINYLKICFILFANIEENKCRAFRKSQFTYLSSEQKKNASKLLDYLSLNLKDFRESCYPLQFDERELYNSTLFTKKPFVKIEDFYFLISSTYFSFVFSYGLYDSMKNKRKFRSEFGKVYEKYLFEQLRETFPNAILDQNIKSLAPANSSIKTCDGVVETEEYILLFEFKATELPEEILIDPSKDFDLMENSLIKGVAQGFSTVELLKSCGSPMKKQVSQKEVILFIVTYKETYMGNAKSDWESINNILKDRYKISENSNLKQDNIFFISIDDFDWLMLLGKNIDTVINQTLESFGQKTASILTDILKKFLTKDSKIEKLDKVFNDFFDGFLEELLVANPEWRQS